MHALRKMLFFAVFLFAFSFFAASAMAEPIPIRTVQELSDIRLNPSEDYILKNDLNLASIAWTPIPNFSGHFDGNDHTISGLNVTLGGAEHYAGLFGFMNGATVSNLNLSGAVISVSNPTSFVNVTFIGTPDNLFEYDPSDTPRIVGCHVQGTLELEADSCGDWPSLFALACAYDSTAEIEVTLHAQNHHGGLLWNCTKCRVDGDAQARAQNGTIARLLDCMDCKSTGNLIIEDCSGDSCGLFAAGILGDKLRAQNCIITDCKLEHAGVTSLIENGRSCVYTGELVSNNGRFIYHSRNCDAFCTATNTASAQAVSLRIVEDDDTEYSGNIAEGSFTLQHEPTGTCEISSFLGSASADNVTLNLRSDTASSIKVSLWKHDELTEEYPYHEADIDVVTGSGNINIACNLTNTGSISCHSDTGNIDVLGGSYNTGVINVGTDGNVMVNGASICNTGDITVSGGGEYCHVRGIDGTLAGGDVPLINTGNLYVYSSATGDSSAYGILGGQNGTNSGSVTLVDYSSEGESAAGGVGSHSGGVNLGNVENRRASGAAYAAGVSGSGCVNYGDITATGNTSGSVTAWGFLDGGGSATGTVYAINSGDGHAIARNTYGRTIANGMIWSEARGGSPSASSNAYGLSVQNGNVGWVLTWHSRYCGCANYYLINSGANPTDDWHYYSPRCQTDVISGTVAPFPGFPVAELPDKEERRGDLTVTLKAIDPWDYKEITSFTLSFGSLSWGEINLLGDPDDFSRFDLSVQIENNTKSAINDTVTLVLPDGFSFSDEELNSRMPLSVNLGPDEAFLTIVPVYPIYLNSNPGSFWVFPSAENNEAVVNSFVPNIEKNPDEGKVYMRPSLGVNIDMDHPFTETISIMPVEDFTGTSSQYSDNRLVFGATLSQAAYNSPNNENNGAYIIQSLHNLGFSNIEWYCDASTFNENAEDYRVAVAFAHKRIIRDGEIYNIIAAVVRGTVSYEWIGNFDVEGADAYHKNFAKCAQYVKQKFEEYLGVLDKRGISYSNMKIFACGHSRGGAVVDLVAHDWNIDGPGVENVYAYTYAAPNSVKSVYVAEDANIFNYVYKYDIVPFVPHGEYGKHGLTIVVGGEDENDLPQTVKKAYARYARKSPTDVNWVGLRLALHLLLSTDSLEQLYPFVTEYQKSLGKIFAENKPISFIANAHCGENYVAWAINNKTIGAMFSDDFEFQEKELLREEIRRLKQAEYVLNSLNASIPSDELSLLISSAITTIDEETVFKILGDIIIKMEASHLKKTVDLENNYALTMYFFPIVFTDRVNAFAVNCPVNTQVMDDSGALVASFAGHELLSSNDEGIAYGNGSSDFIVLPGDQNYTFILTATDDGRMSIDYASFSNSETCDAATCILNIPVHKGEVFTFSSMGGADSLPVLTSSTGAVYDTSYNLELLPDPAEFLFIPEGTKQIDSEAFSGIASRVVIIPESVEKISASAFSNCSRLEIIYFENGNLTVADNFLSGCSTSVQIMAPEGSTVAQQEALYRQYLR